MTKPIDCGIHDHLELACVYGYELSVTFANSEGTQTIVGKALTLDTTLDTQVPKEAGSAPKKMEILRLEQDSRVATLPLLEIVRIEVLTPNAQFKVLDL